MTTDQTVSAPHENASMLAWYIAVELERLRTDADLPMSAIAKRLGCSVAHVNHLEKGRNLPKGIEIEALLDFYGLGERLPSFLELLEAAKSGQDWFEPFEGARPKWFDLFLGLENAASMIESWDAMALPGLFQLPPYHEHVIRAFRPDLDAAEIQRRIALRQARQRILTRPNAPTITAVIDESVLYKPVKGMHEQLVHLDTMAGLPNVTIQIFPMSLGPGIGQHGSFVMLSLPHLDGLPAVAYVDGVEEGTYHRKTDAVRKYRNILTLLHDGALHPEESRDRIRQRAEEYQ